MDNTLYRFVKASERLPEQDNNNLHLKINLGGNKPINKLGWLRHDNTFATDSGNYDSQNVEWLEPVAEDNQQELWERYRKAFDDGLDTEKMFLIIPKQVK